MATTETTVKQRLISADSHVTITDEAFLAHVPAKHLEAAKGVIAQAKARAAASNLPNNRADRNWPAQGRPGDFDQRARIEDQDIDHVEAEVLYGQPGSFGVDGAVFYGIADPAAQLACFQAFNNTLADWIAAAPQAFDTRGGDPRYGSAVGVAELERIAGLGFRAATLPSYPDTHDFPYYWDEQYSKLWATFAETKIPISLHTATTPGLQKLQQADPTPPKAIFQSLPPIFMAELVGSWIASGLLAEHPGLHIVLVEAGIGWIGYYLERLDTMQLRHNWTARGLSLKDPPSSYWFRQCHATFEDDLCGMRTLDRVGVENVMWASDYPHPDSTWPESQIVVEKHFQDLPDEDKQKIVWRNAAKLYGLD